MPKVFIVNCSVINRIKKENITQSNEEEYIFFSSVRLTLILVLYFKKIAVNIYGRNRQTRNFLSAASLNCCCAVAAV